MDTLLGLTLIGVAVVVARHIATVSRDPVHPLTVFTLTWIGIFGVGHLRLSETYDEAYYAEPFGVREVIALVLSLGVAGR